MGKKKDKKMSDLLSEMKEAESGLARNEIQKEKEFYGNFSEFPDGHPVKKSIDSKLGNRERMDEAVYRANDKSHIKDDEETEPLDFSIEHLIQSIKDGKETKITKPKKVISRKIAEEKKRVEREENVLKVKSVCNDINNDISGIVSDIEGFKEKLKNAQIELNKQGFSTAKYIKLERVISSFSSILNESKINTKRLY